MPAPGDHPFTAGAQTDGATVDRIAGMRTDRLEFTRHGGQKKPTG